MEMNEEISSYTIGPIIANGDPIGAVIIYSKEGTLGEVEQKAVETAAGFLARQMESNNNKSIQIKEAAYSCLFILV